ncbi:hypothetical protein B566_EDAN017500, partial [Ephemera danica]
MARIAIFLLLATVSAVMGSQIKNSELASHGGSLGGCEVPGCPNAGFATMYGARSFIEIAQIMGKSRYASSLYGSTVTSAKPGRPGVYNGKRINLGPGNDSSSFSEIAEDNSCSSSFTDSFTAWPRKIGSRFESATMDSAFNIEDAGAFSNKSTPARSGNSGSDPVVSVGVRLKKSALLCSLTDNHFWISGHKIGRSTWLWINGDIILFTDWATGQPSDPYTEHCINIMNNKWNDEDCDYYDSSTYGFICEEREVVKESNSEQRSIYPDDLLNLVTLDPTTGKKYLFANASADWFEASYFCNAYGMDLVTIETQKENDLIL